MNVRATRRTTTPASTVTTAAAPTATDPANHPGLDPAVREQRIAAGRIAEMTADTLPPGLVGRPAPTYFETYDQLKARLYALQDKYPNLVTVKDIGDSSEKRDGKADRDILAITLTNKSARGTKPIVEHVGGVHAREIANPELLMRWGQQLLEGYGRDPEATSILNTREIDLVPMVNPDGHAVVERAYAGQPDGSLMQRKNTSGQDGTDLNRNFDFHWGGPGASSFPQSETYRGPSAASEQETKSVEAYNAERKPNMFHDWHSYSQLVLYPWGDTKQHAPDYDGLKAVADKYATYNHYSPIQSIDLYATTGTSDDDAYGRLKIPSWAVETGRSFHQSDREFEQTWAENAPVLWYSAKIADDPFNRAQGPDTLDVLVDPSTRTVKARATDATNGKDAIRAAELLTDPGAAPGTGISLTAADGSFNGVDEALIGSVGDLSFQPGRLVYVRAQDAKGNWGPATAQWLAGPPTDRQLRAREAQRSRAAAAHAAKAAAAT